VHQAYEGRWGTWPHAHRHSILTRLDL
jgi:hypothetical protein